MNGYKIVLLKAIFMLYRLPECERVCSGICNCIHCRKATTKPQSVKGAFLRMLTYKWSKEGIMIPSIVVGTDDAGIFATNIYNEYCHIYCMLVFNKGLSPYEAMEYIERLVHNAKVYVFR